MTRRTPSSLDGLVDQLAEGIARPAAPQPVVPPLDPVAPKTVLLDGAVAPAPPLSEGAHREARRLIDAIRGRTHAAWALEWDGGSLDVHEGGTVRIGRGGKTVVDVRIDVPSVSRFHCAVVARAGRTFVEDGGSRNGTEVRRGNRTIPVDGPVDLQDADVIAVRKGVVIAVVRRG